MAASLLLASGRVFAEDADGAVRALQPGSELVSGEIVVTGAASAAVFRVPGEGDISLGGAMRWDPEWGAPVGEVYQAATTASTLDAGDLGLASHDDRGSGAQDLAELFRAADTVVAQGNPASLSDDVTEVPSDTDLISELAGLMRALQAVAVSAPEGLPLLQEQLAEVQAALSATPAGSLPPMESVEQLFVLLDRAQDAAYREYGRHADDEVSLLARGDGGLQVDALMQDYAAAGPAIEVGASAAAAASDAEVLDAHSLLEDLTVQPLGDLLSVENIAGATRMTVREGGEDETSSLWLNLPMGGLESLLGFDAPEFALPDTA